MFQGLQAGMPLYILYKNEPRVADARVVSVNTHPPIPNPNNPMALLNGPVTDVTVSVDGKNLPPFQGLAPQAIMATFSSEGMVVSEDKGVILRELDSLEESHQRIVDSYEPSKAMVEKCRALKLQLNPEKQKELAQAKELSELRGQIDELKGMVSALLGTASKDKEK